MYSILLPVVLSAHSANPLPHRPYTSGETADRTSVPAVPTTVDTAADSDTSAHALIDYLADELTYYMENLVVEDGTRPYYISYTVYDEQRGVVSATLGALTQRTLTANRDLNVDVRVGDYSLDNTHQLRGTGQSYAPGSGNIPVSLEADPYSMRHALWYQTDRAFKRAVRRLSRIKTDLKIKVGEEDKSDDFSHEQAHIYYEAPAKLSLDTDAWANRVRKVSAIARDYPLIYSSSVTVGAFAGTRYMVTSENARLQTSQTRFRITVQAGTKAEDGMDLTQSFAFNAASRERLPSAAEMEAAFRRVIDQVLSLRRAEIAEPYTGPAILRNRAAGVFFHEIFGHRIEGHRQKDVTEGQTFKTKVGQSVLPDFISVYDDPTAAQQNGIDLRGHYRFDDEGVRASRVTLVEDGILRSFLLSRRPVAGFPQSNGHGRRQPGRAVTSRQANLIVESSKRVGFDTLRQLLREECKRQEKPYGLLFEDISGGFTTTSRRGPQSFKVVPIVVYRVYTDGRPDELIRGADIVGTPLTCFEKIVCTGDDPDVFNGSCGAESGWIPVSAVSPSILVSMIEIEKRTRDQARPPILEPPLRENR